ncbi:MAG TPA: hypothetical protein VG142_16005 [Trebonia sp.]|nr:hypothetical protein [Trebonia sp.]
MRARPGHRVRLLPCSRVAALFMDLISSLERARVLDRLAGPWPGHAAARAPAAAPRRDPGHAAGLASAPRSSPYRTDPDEFPITVTRRGDTSGKWRETTGIEPAGLGYFPCGSEALSVCTTWS